MALGRHYDQAGVPYDKVGMTYDGPAIGGEFITDSGECVITLTGRGRRKVAVVGGGGGEIHIGPLADVGPAVPEDLEFIIRDAGVCVMSLIPLGQGIIWFGFPEEDDELALLGLL